MLIIRGMKMFDSKKVLQEIGYLLALNGNKMNLLKLIKELYLSDRASIDERDFSISGDVYLSMKNGPVLSLTLNLLNDLSGGWEEYLESVPDVKYYPNIILKKPISEDRLTEKDKEYLKHISDSCKNKTEWQLVDETHKLPEWKSVPKGTQEEINFTDILRALGRSDEEIEAIQIEYDQLRMFDTSINVSA